MNLAKGTTNDLGYYSLSFPRTGSAVCIIIRPAENGKTTVYDEKSGKDLPLLNTSKFRMVMIYPESKIGANSRKTLFVSPFSRIVAKRVQFLTKQNPGTSIERLHTRASKELVIRFGLNQGLNVKKHVTFQKKSQSVSEEEVPELDDLLVELENPSSAVTAKFVSVLVGISYLASKYKNGGEVSLDDLDEVIEAFTADFADGTFDGKTPDGQSITIGSGANQITFSSDPLGDVLLPAIANYIAEGGTLFVGIPTKTPPPTLSASDITNQIQFAGNVPITSSDFAPPTVNLVYSSTNYNLVMGQAISPITPNIAGGTISSCSANPPLPSGLSLSSSCVISGTPSVATTTSYTITGTYVGGTTSYVITLNIIDPNVPPSGLSYGGSSFTFQQGVSISPLSPSVTGVVTTYSVSPSLPSGLSLNATNGVISGTPTTLLGATNFTITASNSYGSTSITLSLSVIIAPPSNLSYPQSNYTFIKNQAISNQTPSVTGVVTTYSVSPSLPSGLSLNATNGVISGTPTVLQSSQNYTITATNSSGSTSVTISITVNPAAPSGLSYPSSEYNLKSGASICSITPTVTGEALTFSVSPSLPSGLSLNSSTGQITGNPSSASSATTYTVTAANATGNTSFNLSISVDRKFQFTNAGQTGRTGPTQTQVNSAYACNSLNGLVTINTQGIQEWTVPATGTYRIEAAGAQGGSNLGATGGLGARMIGDFTLTSGEVLSILVGQSGLIDNPDGNRGGGGGSFVWRKSDNTLYIAAGGGGGAGGTGSNGIGGSASTSGTTMSNGTGTAGTGGNGANNGAGWYSNGSNVGDSGTLTPKRPLEEGVGGDGYSLSTHFGGFGGGRRRWGSSFYYQ